jgi:hypothetical protein
MSNENSNGANETDVVVGLANQLAHVILIALKVTHTYIVPRAESHGIKLSARDKHAWAMNLAIALSQNKAYLKLPATRLEKRTQKPVQKTSAPLFADRKQESEALGQVRQLMKDAGVTEAELLGIMREGGTREAMFAADLSAIPDKMLRLAIERWETVVELAAAGRARA